MVLINVDKEKFAQDKEKYNKTYLEYIKKQWHRSITSASYQLCHTKKETTKQKYKNMIDKAWDEIFKCQELLLEL